MIITATILVTLVTPPGLKEWRLTGKHRIVAGKFVKGQKPEFIMVN